MKLQDLKCGHSPVCGSSAGNTRGLIEAANPAPWWSFACGSSAGNTRGLIEAGRRTRGSAARRRLPRGIPAASLKPTTLLGAGAAVAGLPRGIPAASLKRELSLDIGPGQPESSAGNTRGLIEATARGWPCPGCERLPRGIPAASLKRADGAPTLQPPSSLPRGIPAASLKQQPDVVDESDGRLSSAGNTRGLIEADGGWSRDRRGHVSSAGNTRGLIEANCTSNSAPAAPGSSAGNTRGLIEAT